MFTSTHTTLVSGIAVDAQRQYSDVRVSCFQDPPWLPGRLHSQPIVLASKLVFAESPAEPTEPEHQRTLTLLFTLSQDGQRFKVALELGENSHVRRHDCLFCHVTSWRRKWGNVTCCFGCRPLGGSSGFYSWIAVSMQTKVMSKSSLYHIFHYVPF